MIVSPWLTFAVSAIGVILIPILVLLYKIVVNITTDRDRISTIARDMNKLVEDKDKVHNELYQQMREDRKATNERLRWLEENVWKTGRRNGTPRPT